MSQKMMSVWWPPAASSLTTTLSRASPTPANSPDERTQTRLAPTWQRQQRPAPARRHPGGWQKPLSQPYYAACPEARPGGGLLSRMVEPKPRFFSRRLSGVATVVLSKKPWVIPASLVRVGRCMSGGRVGGCRSCLGRLLHGGRCGLPPTGRRGVVLCRRARRWWRCHGWCVPLGSSRVCVRVCVCSYARGPECVLVSLRDSSGATLIVRGRGYVSVAARRTPRDVGFRCLSG
jgi:hypothetical protein